MGKRDHYQLVPEDDPSFVEFWATYPKRVAKKDARRAWARINPSPATVDRILSALSWQVMQPAWQKDGGQYIPYPATWLNAERWDDEPTLPAAKTQASTAAMGVLETLLGGRDERDAGPSDGAGSAGGSLRCQGLYASPDAGLRRRA